MANQQFINLATGQGARKQIRSKVGVAPADVDAAHNAREMLEHTQRLKGSTLVDRGTGETFIRNGLVVKHSKPLNTPAGAKARKTVNKMRGK